MGLQTDDPESDADGDGVELILEYLGSMNPLLADNFSQSVFLDRESIGIELKLDREELPIDLELSLQAATDLSNQNGWAKVPSDHTVKLDRANVWTHRWTTLKDPHSPVFYRLNVVRPWDSP